MRCNKDLCFLILHLKLCVLAIDPGTSTYKHRDRHPTGWGHYRWYQTVHTFPHRFIRRCTHFHTGFPLDLQSALHKIYLTVHRYYTRFIRWNTGQKFGSPVSTTQDLPDVPSVLHKIYPMVKNLDLPPILHKIYLTVYRYYTRFTR